MAKKHTSYSMVVFRKKVSPSLRGKENESLKKFCRPIICLQHHMLTSADRTPAMEWALLWPFPGSFFQWIGGPSPKQL